MDNAHATAILTSFEATITYTCFVGNGTTGEPRFLDGHTSRKIMCISPGVWVPQLTECEGTIAISDLPVYLTGSHQITEVKQRWSLGPVTT